VGIVVSDFDTSVDVVASSPPRPTLSRLSLMAVFMNSKVVNLCVCVFLCLCRRSGHQNNETTKMTLERRIKDKMTHARDRMSNMSLRVGGLMSSEYMRWMRSRRTYFTVAGRMILSGQATMESRGGAQTNS
jgi:hypothetical protein